MLVIAVWRVLKADRRCGEQTRDGQHCTKYRCFFCYVFLYRVGKALFYSVAWSHQQLVIAVVFVAQRCGSLSLAAYMALWPIHSGRTFSLLFMIAMLSADSCAWMGTLYYDCLAIMM